ncbi:Uncharacterised protein [Weissella viridescens]|uniref:Uncharacterized protein n=1 Tax=Weissella viridescens TaxID=1629 RepID=A0A380NXW7_WEIVI|nr:Uncharacterised protein [Weissella viridescens]
MDWGPCFIDRTYVYESPESLETQGIQMHMQTEVTQADLTDKRLKIKI